MIPDSATTNQSGEYIFDSLYAGLYRVQASHDGFLMSEQDSFDISRDSTSLDFSLRKLGDMDSDSTLLVSDLVLWVALWDPTSGFSFNPEDTLVADMNGDGERTVNDLILLRNEVLGDSSFFGDLPEPSDLVAVSVDVDGSDRDLLSVSVNVTDAQSIGGLEFWFLYDRSMYELVDVRKGSGLGNMNFTYVDTDGRIKILIYGMEPIDNAEEREICHLDFRPFEPSLFDPSGISLEGAWFSDMRGNRIEYKVHGTGEDGSLTLVYPRSYQLYQNFPNPFNPSTTIVYDIPDEQGQAGVRLWIYDLRGRLVRKLVDRENLPGRYTVNWDGRSDRGERVGSGIYFYRLTVGDFTATRKLVVIK
jgi:hypothetical protein